MLDCLRSRHCRARGWLDERGVTGRKLALFWFHGLEEEPAMVDPPGERACVVVSDDDHTGMPFVIEVFRSTLGLSSERARELMLEVHQRKRAVVFRGDVVRAREVCARVNARAAEQLYPLLARLDARDAATS